MTWVPWLATLRRDAIYKGADRRGGAGLRRLRNPVAVAFAVVDGRVGGDGFGARYTCGGPFTFGPELLDRPGGDEDAATPLAAALRDTVGPRNPDEDGALPRDGWILVGQRGAQAQFVAPGDDGVHVVSLEAPNGVWRVMDRGFCSPSLVVPPRIGLAEWDIEPGQQIGPETKSFMALVTEVACASGSPRMAVSSGRRLCWPTRGCS